MPLDKWPCIPSDDFESLFPKDLPHFLQAGVNHLLGRAVSLIDPNSGKRFDSFNRFDSFQPFCLKLRNGVNNDVGHLNWDNNCMKCDLHIARYLTKKLPDSQNKQLPFTRYRCYIGLEELGTVISIGGLRIMMVSGQFMPSTGVEDIKQILNCLGKHQPGKTDVSDNMWSSIAKFNLPKELWVNGEIFSEENLAEMFRLADKLKPYDDDFRDRFLKEAERIQEIALRYYELAKGKVEANIMQEITFSLSDADPSNKHLMWENISHALGKLIEELDFRYCGYFSGFIESDTLLHLRASAGQLPLEFSSGAVHFNWRKAGIKTNDQRDNTSHIYNWSDIGYSNTGNISKGLKGIANQSELITLLIPVKLPKGPFGLLILGPHNQSIDLKIHESFIFSACRDLCTRILTLQLSNILREDRTNWEKTAKLSGHRLRSSIQSIGSQLKTINAVNNGDSAFLPQERNNAENDLDIAFKNLTELSYSAESSIPGTLDVKSVSRDVLRISDVVWEAISTQQDLADQFGIEINVYEEIQNLPLVLANPILMRSAFINLINNGLKYSYPRQQDRERVFRIKPSYELHDPREVSIEFVNYGLGVKEEDKSRIFDWGVRLSEASATFKEVYGKGIGLWEVKHIIEGHGGKIFVKSVHSSKAPVTDQNIKQCITVFTVVLPIAESMQDSKGE